MPAKKPKETKRSSDEAVKAKTGKVWAEWFKILDKAGAKKMPHKEIALYLYEKQKLPAWWCQMVAVGYEQERGLRQKFQKCDGEFSASRSRTMAAPLAKAYAAWTDEKLRNRWLPNAKNGNHLGNAGKICAREMGWRFAGRGRLQQPGPPENASGRGPRQAVQLERMR